MLEEWKYLGLTYNPIKYRIGVHINDLKDFKIDGSRQTTITKKVWDAVANNKNSNITIITTKD